MKKLKYLLLLPFLLLSSCGAKEIYGKYGFAMGNQKGAHFGIYAELSRDKYVDPNVGDVNDKKIFKLTLDLPAPTLQYEENSEEDGIITDLVGGLLGQLLTEDPLSISGYYYPGDSTSMGLRINIGVPTIDEIVGEEISKTIIELVICAFINNEVFNIHIPVSIIDLQMQLCWYGYLINIKDLKIVDLYTVFDTLPGIGGKDASERGLRVGTIPTKEEIAEMNRLLVKHKDKVGEFTFRIPHVVAIGLSRI